uniref:F-box domain-containing protein n=1 Tax=Brassica campestris TaxID=3711 RepID=M4FFH6_BRACM
MGMISDLPDQMLLEILSWLPTTQVVATMLLSKQWKFLWRQVPKLYYNYSEHEGRDFSEFVSRSLQSQAVAEPENFFSRFVLELEIDLTAAQNPMITALPKSMYTCETLSCLRLKALVLDDIPEDYPICLSSLNYLYISVSIQVSADKFIGKLSAGAPLLKKTVVQGPVYGDDFLDSMTSYSELRSFTTCLSESCNSRPLSSWNQPGFTSTTHVPECLSTTLQTLEWRDYAETEFDMPVVSFLLKNATRLSEAKIFPESAAGPIEKLRIRTGLAKLSRGSPLCHLNLGN